MPEVLRPLYESSRVLAQKMTVAVSLLFITLYPFLCYSPSLQVFFLGIKACKANCARIQW